MPPCHAKDNKFVGRAFWFIISQVAHAGSGCKTSESGPDGRRESEPGPGSIDKGTHQAIHPFHP